MSSGVIVQPVTGLIDIMETLLPPATLESVLVFNNGLKTDESVYTCIGINNITNIIQSPEQDNITLLVQGNVMTIMMYKYIFNFLLQFQ